MRRLALVASIFVALALSSCALMQNTKARIPTETIASRETDDFHRMVIVLPGIGDTLEVMSASGIVDVIQRSMPDATVMLVEFSWPYYAEGRGARRLHDEIVEPARQHGYRDIYLAGASMGGMGVLMYEHQYPNEMRGLILMAPFMGIGSGSMLKEIAAAGGLTRWNPGPQHARFTEVNAPREQWRVVHSWIAHPERARNVWLICGRDDRMHSTAEIISSLVPAANYFTPPGGHAWRVWTQGAAEAFAAIEANSG